MQRQKGLKSQPTKRSTRWKAGAPRRSNVNWRGPRPRPGPHPAGRSLLDLDLGARVVARAWVDPEFKARLLENATAAISELGYGGLQGEHLIAVENTPKAHNVVVCTLCSCYPWSVLGLPPTWYKSAPYRARAVRDPRGLLGEFGLHLDDDIEIQVWDSNAEMRYLVLPMRPEGTESMSEKELADIVNRDAMVGTAVVSLA